MNIGDFIESEKRFRYCYKLYKNDYCYNKIQWFENNVYYKYLENIFI